MKANISKTLKNQWKNNNFSYSLCRNFFENGPCQHQVGPKLAENGSKLIQVDPALDQVGPTCNQVGTRLARNEDPRRY